jgi:hypothetical protein
LGAILDLVGAMLLARALAFATARTLIVQSTSGYSGLSTPLIRMFAEQQIDATFGLVLLTFGFAMQALAGAGCSRTTFVFATGLVALVGVCISYLALRRRLWRWRFKLACLSWRPEGRAMWNDDEIEKMWKDTERMLRGAVTRRLGSRVFPR